MLSIFMQKTFSPNLIIKKGEIMNINSIQSPAFCAKFSNDSETKKVLSDVMKKQQPVYTYSLIKNLEALGVDGKISLSYEDGKDIYAHSSITGNSLKLYQRDDTPDLYALNAIIKKHDSKEHKKLFGNNTNYIELSRNTINKRREELDIRSNTTYYREKDKDFQDERKMLMNRKKMAMEAIKRHMDNLHAKEANLQSMMYKKQNEYIFSLIA